MNSIPTLAIIKESLERFKIDSERFIGIEDNPEDVSKLDDALVVLCGAAMLTVGQLNLTVAVTLYAYHLGCSRGEPDSVVAAGTDILRRLEDVQTKGL